MKKMDELKTAFKRNGFENMDYELDLLEGGQEVKVSMEYDETPALMKDINENTDFQAILSPSTNDIIIRIYK